MKMFKVYLNAQLCDLSCYFAFCYIYAESEAHALERVLAKYPQMRGHGDFQASEVKDFEVELHD